MSVADRLDALAALCHHGSVRALETFEALGDRPATPPDAASLWDQRADRLQGQSNRLGALSTNLSAEALVAALHDAADSLATLDEVSARADASIARIAEIDTLLTTLARVLNVGVAVVTLAAVPSPGNGAAVVKAIEALSAQVTAAKVKPALS